MAQEHKGKVIVGGPGAMLMRDKIDWAEVRDTTPYDVLSMHNPFATFTTRGCINKCKFCAVPKIEGEFRELDTWKPAPIVCDNNLLACSKKHFERVIESLMPFEYVDFNQGLQASLFDSWHAERLTKLKHVKVRFSFDYTHYEAGVRGAVDLCREYGLDDISIYVLIGFKDTKEDALYRLERVRSWGIYPAASRFQPLDATVKNEYVPEAWDRKELLKMSKYYYRLNWTKKIPYDDFEYPIKKRDRKTMDMFEGGG